MIGTTSDVGDFAQLGDELGSGLDLYISGEA
jgi:hypothetical protein